MDRGQAEKMWEGSWNQRPGDRINFFFVRTQLETESLSSEHTVGICQSRLHLIRRLSPDSESIQSCCCDRADDPIEMSRQRRLLPLFTHTQYFESDYYYSGEEVLLRGLKYVNLPTILHNSCRTEKKKRDIYSSPSLREFVTRLGGFR